MARQRAETNVAQTHQAVEIDAMKDSKPRRGGHPRLHGVVTAADLALVYYVDEYSLKI